MTAVVPPQLMTFSLESDLKYEIAVNVNFGNIPANNTHKGMKLSNEKYENCIHPALGWSVRDREGGKGEIRRFKFKVHQN